MTTIQAPSATNPFAGLTQSAVGTTRASTEVQDRFLKLLVSQLQNQDPLNPLDNAQFTTQLAQLSAVDGINKIDRAIAGLAERFEGLQTLQGASLVGRQVLIEGTSLDLYNHSGKAGFELQQGADNVTVSIKDNSGIELDVIELGAQNAGIHQFTWDGITTSGVPAIDGRYQFSITASASGEPVDATRLAFARVDGVAPNSEGMQLALGGYGNVAFGQVKQIV